MGGTGAGGLGAVSAELSHPLVWLWAAFGVGFVGTRAVVLVHRARGRAWMVTGA